MKKIGLLVILTIFTLFGCKTWDASMVRPKTEPINPKLLSLERRMEDFANTTVYTNESELKLFTQEVETNLIDPYGEKFGYIALSKNVLKHKVGLPQLVLSIALFTLPNIFGMPFLKVSYKVEVEMRILDRENRLIGKYSAIGESKSKVAYYYGYSFLNANRKVYPEAMLDAFNKIRPQIQADAARLNEKLLAAGKI
jgi:hypothetical protein